MVKTSVRALLSVAVTGREEGFNGNRNQPNYLSTMERGKLEQGRRSCFGSAPPRRSWLTHAGTVVCQWSPQYGLRRSLDVSGLPCADSAASFVEQAFVVAEADFA